MRKSTEAKRNKPSPQLLALIGRSLTHQALPDGTVRRISTPLFGRSDWLARGGHGGEPASALEESLKRLFSLARALKQQNRGGRNTLKQCVTMCSGKQLENPNGSKAGIVDLSAT